MPDSVAGELESLDRELAEIDLLIQQATAEASRQESRRAQAESRVRDLEARPEPSADELREANAALVAATRRAALMEGQADVLDGKRKSAIRFRERLSLLAEALEAAPQAAVGDGAAVAGPGGDGSRPVDEPDEALRREIARQMHDGPAQSLTNITLQAQIVQRLLRTDPGRAEAELDQLTAMVQATLDATKTFIFDVRPMVLDDLGLVPTLRRASRERSAGTEVPVSFETVGPDRRLSTELEGAIFRILDDALRGFLATRPERVELRLEWEPGSLVAVARAIHAAVGDGEREPDDSGEIVETPPRGDLPPALVEMIRAQRAEEGARRTARAEALARARALPDATWRTIEARAGRAGLAVELTDDGQGLRLTASAE